MTKREDISRRGFIGSALSTAALSSLSPRELFAKGGAVGPGTQATTQREIPPLVDNPGWKEQGVENLTKSRYAKLRNVPVHAVTIKTGFWGRRRETNVSKSIPTMHDLLEANGRMTNFRRLTGKSQGAQSGPVYSDSDVYKWIEAAGFALQSGDRPELRATVEKLIGDVVSAQEPGGYLNTYYVNDHASQRMLPQTQTTGHELYNMGHMLQGAIAYYRATGDRKMLDAGIRFVNEFLIPNYGQEPKKPIVSGHPEIELALIELYRITGDKLQLDLAGYILRGDERIKLPTGRTIYMFSGTPFTPRTKLEGHAVRATARSTAIEIRWPSILQRARKFATRGTTRPVAPRTSSARSPRSQDISIAPAMMESTSTFTIVPISTGTLKTARASKSPRKQTIPGTAA